MALLDEKYFRELADGLGADWEKFASELDFRKSEIDKLKLDIAGVDDQIFGMLVAWGNRQRALDVAAAETLIAGLRKINQNGLACKLEERIARSCRPANRADAPDAAVHFTAHVINPLQQPANQQQPPSSSSSQQPSSSQHQPHAGASTTYTYQSPPGTAPYVGKLTITGQNSPVIIGSVSNSTFNFGGGGGGGDKH